MFKLKIDPNLVVFDFYYKSLFQKVDLWQEFLGFLVMTLIQDHWQHIKLRMYPHLVVFSFHSKSLSLMVGHDSDFGDFW